MASARIEFCGVGVVVTSIEIIATHHLVLVGKTDARYDDKFVIADKERTVAEQEKDGCLAPHILYDDAECLQNLLGNFPCSVGRLQQHLVDVIMCMRSCVCVCVCVCCCVCVCACACVCMFVNRNA